MGYPVCPNRIHSSGINGPWKSLFETTKSFLGDGHRLKLFLGVWESGEDYLLYTSFPRETTAKGRLYPGIECLKSIDKFAALSSWYKLPSDLTTITAGLQFYSCSQIMFYNNDNDLSGI